MHKNDLNIIKEVPADYSMIEAKIHNNNLVVSGLQGFNIYDISDASNPKLSYQYRTGKAYEYQGCDFFDTDSCQYLVFARFADYVEFDACGKQRLQQILLADEHVVVIGYRTAGP